MNFASSTSRRTQPWEAGVPSSFRLVLLMEEALGWAQGMEWNITPPSMRVAYWAQQSYR